MNFPAPIAAVWRMARAVARRPWGFLLLVAVLTAPLCAGAAAAGEREDGEGISLERLFEPLIERLFEGREPLESARAEGDAWAQIALPPRTSAGQPIVLVIGAAPAGVEEFEILLSLDDGRSFPLRASRERDVREREVTWQVPNVAAARARLRLRYRSGGREIPGPMSAPFAIVSRDAESGVPPPARSRESRLFHESGWWEGLDPAVPSGRAGLAANAPSFDAARAAPAAELVPLPASLGTAASRITRAPAGLGATPLVIRPGNFTAERSCPLRN